jgi:hypothetical protein
MSDAASPVVQQHMREVLDHFDTCPECGYAAQAFITATYYADGRTTVGTLGRCALPCGWSGPTEVLKMTEQRR